MITVVNSLTLFSSTFAFPSTIDPVPIAWDYDQPPPMFNWTIFEYELVTNPTFGVDQMIWTDVALTIGTNNIGQRRRSFFLVC